MSVMRNERRIEVFDSRSSKKRKLSSIRRSAILPQFGQQPLRNFRACPRQRAEQVVIGMLRKQFFDLLTIVLQLRLK
jgi:hypothetical protein